MGIWDGSGISWTTHTRTRTHPFNSPGLPRWAGTRKVKPTWILLKQETVSGSGISWAICKSAPRSRHITTPAPHHSVFYRPDALPATQPTASKHWNQLDHMQTIYTSLQTDNRTNTSSLNFYRLDALPDAQATVSKHWRQMCLCSFKRLQKVYSSFILMNSKLKRSVIPEFTLLFQFWYGCYGLITGKLRSWQRLICVVKATTKLISLML